MSKSALSRLFPNADARPWTCEVFHEDDEGEVPDAAKNGALIPEASTVPYGDGDAMSEANVRLIVHAVNTYDARDAALREALEWIRVRADECTCSACSKEAGECDTAAFVAKLESALAANQDGGGR